MKDPKDKAEELIDKFDECLNHIACGSNGIEDHLKERAKQCALICVNEIINSYGNNEWYNNDIQYWNQIKRAIEEL